MASDLNRAQEKAPVEPSRESQMVTLRRDAEGKPIVWCDREIADIVDALNTGTLSTGASCSGHGFRPGFVLLDDGRWLFIATEAQRHVIDAAFPLDINGSAVAQGEVPAEPSAKPPAARCNASIINGKWEGAEEWMPLAWELCANECGEEACTELIWEGGPVPEPWGDRWLKYEDQAKEMIAMVRKHVATPPARDAGLSLTDEKVDEIREHLNGMNGGHIGYLAGQTFARAILAAAQEKHTGEATPTKPQHVCGQQGFGALGDTCPACDSKEPGHG
jgi:hypothetical protein